MPDPRMFLVFDPAALSPPQREGQACVVCMKAWPLPQVNVGHLPDHTNVYACAECSGLLTGTTEILVPAPRSRHHLHLDLHVLTASVRSLIERVQTRHIPF